MFNIMIGKYIPLNSKIHQMNPISKIICLLLFLILLMFDSTIMLALLSILTILVISFSQIPFKVYLRSIKALKVLIVFLFLITLIFNGSWYQMITSLIKIILGILYTMVLTYTTSKSEITYGLENVFSPLSVFKLPVKQMSLSLTLALRFIPNIFEQTDKIMKSQASRGIDFGHSNVKGKVIAISSMIVPMFILSTRKADMVADIMEVRLYRGDIKRTTYRHHKWSHFDENMILLHLGLLIYNIIRMVIV
ncbi:MAG: energy-coupling factor transporter transmembrane protein EcfT [Bacilli bacterium]|nr:energy-coupling factor transporter transmembrane protein EcfT [Bacilli bacterium]